MTVKEAAERWGCTTKTVSRYAMEGRIPGAYKESIPEGGSRWIFPDGAEKPMLIMPQRRNKRFVQNACIFKSTNALERYIWRNQGKKSIRDIANALHITTREVVVIYDRMFERMTENV